MVHDLPPITADSAHREAVHDFCRTAQELMEVRAGNAGKEPTNPVAYAKLQRLKATMIPLARLYQLRGEARAVAAFDTFLHIGVDCVAAVIPDDIDRVVPEYHVGRGRVDRAIFHKSGRLSLVEIKDCCEPRAVVGGIGQALYYAAMAERTCSAAPVVPVLAVLGAHDPDVARACQRGGVEYIALGDVETLRLISEITHWTCFDGA